MSWKKDLLWESIKSIKVCRFEQVCCELIINFPFCYALFSLKILNLFCFVNLKKSTIFNVFPFKKIQTSKTFMLKTAFRRTLSQWCKLLNLFPIFTYAIILARRAPQLRISEISYLVRRVYPVLRQSQIRYIYMKLGFLITKYIHFII